MKRPNKLRRQRGSPSGTRAGRGGRKQAQIAMVDRTLEQESAEAGLVEPAHPARRGRGAVEAGESAEARGGAAAARAKPRRPRAPRSRP